MTILSPLPVDPHTPAAILPDLEAAIAGQACFLPLPLADATRATLLRNTQRAGEPIDPSIALVMSTSGSTGTPKGAQLTPANLVASADATHQVLGGTGQWLLAMPAHHIAGIQVLVRSLVAGVDPLCMDLSEGFDIPTFARAAAELGPAATSRAVELADDNQILDAAQAAGEVDILVNNAGITGGNAPTWELDPATWRQVIDSRKVMVPPSAHS